MSFYKKEHTLISATMGAFLWDDPDHPKGTHSIGLLH